VTRFALVAPAGLISVDADVSQGKVRRVTFRNVRAFAVHFDAQVEVRQLVR
jgi:proline racemase